MRCETCNNDLSVLHDRKECLHCGAVVKDGETVRNYGAIAGVKVIETEQEYESLKGKRVLSRWDGDCVIYEP
jgi:hypothetical protein